MKRANLTISAIAALLCIPQLQYHHHNGKSEIWNKEFDNAALATRR